MDSPQDSRALQPGTLIADYKIDDVLGQGAFGITYLAIDTSLNVRVAIKEYFPREFSVRDTGSTVRPSGSKDDRDFFEWGRDRFLSEARILARLDHPNIVAVRRLLEANRTAYLVMDYCDGRPLDRIIDSDGPLTPGNVDKLVWPLVDALGHIHRAGLIHRDVKPANIFIRSDGSPVLLDFGAARNDISQHSRSVTSLATAGYAPLEQYDTKGNQGPWSDIYGLSATLYRALTGDRPPDAAGRVLGDTLVSIAQRLSGQFDRNLLAAIDQGLAVLPKDRPQSVSEWLSVLKKPPSDNSIGKGAHTNVQRRDVQPDERSEVSSTKTSKVPTYILVGGLVALTAALFFGLSNPRKEERDSNIAVINPITVPTTSSDSASKSDASRPAESGSAKAEGSVTAGSDTPTTSPKQISECPKNLPSNQWNDCKGSAVMESGARHTGYFKSGRLDGPGKVEHNGASYVGGFKDGSYNGRGTYIYANGDKYVGEFFKGNFHGRGEVAFPNGETYKGEFKNGLREGKGLIRFPSGASYEGNFANNKYDGFGKYKYPNGDVFEGSYVADSRVGRGKYTFKDGAVLEGTYVADKVTSPISMRFPTGARYVGDINPVTWAYEGKGTYTYTDGSRFVGEYRNGVPEGSGVEYNAQGVIIRSGTWQSGKFVRADGSTLSTAPVTKSFVPIFARPTPSVPDRPQDVQNMRMCKKWVEDSRSELPLKMDLITTMVDYSCQQAASGVMVVMKYDIDAVITWDASSETVHKNLVAGTISKTCSNNMAKAVLQKIDFEHHYFDKASKLAFVVKLSKSDCR